jgi:beta-glucosidase
VHGWMPVNEPAAYAFGGWLAGEIPPGRSDVGRFAEALEATLLANHEAWRLLRSGSQPTATIMNLSPVTARWDDERGAEAARANAGLYDDVLWRSWIRGMRDGVLSVPGRPERVVEDMAGSFDLIGFSYFNAIAVGPDLDVTPYPDGARVGPLGHAPWAEGLGLVLRRLAEELPGRPLLITGCGLGTPTRADDDGWRAAYLDDCCRITADAIADGVDVRGFFHWTGIDNYEWTHGFDVAFGLLDRDRDPKGSAEVARRWATSTPER